MGSAGGLPCRPSRNVVTRASCCRSAPASDLVKMASFLCLTVPLGSVTPRRSTHLSATLGEGSGILRPAAKASCRLRAEIPHGRERCRVATITLCASVVPDRMMPAATGITAGTGPHGHRNRHGSRYGVSRSAYVFAAGWLHRRFPFDERLSACSSALSLLAVFCTRARICAFSRTAVWSAR